jgi:hypothetical protein
MGTTRSSDRAATPYNSDPNTFPAGTAVRLNSSGVLSVTKADGLWVGVSLGKSLSDHKKTSVLKVGSLVPVKLTTVADYPYVVLGSAVSIDDATGLANEAGVAATVSNATYASGVLDGIQEDGTTVKVALIDMVGGL